MGERRSWRARGPGIIHLGEEEESLLPELRDAEVEHELRHVLILRRVVILLRRVCTGGGRRSAPGESRGSDAAVATGVGRRTMASCRGWGMPLRRAQGAGSLGGRDEERGRERERGEERERRGGGELLPPAIYYTREIEEGEDYGGAQLCKASQAPAARMRADHHELGTDHACRESTVPCYAPPSICMPPMIRGSRTSFNASSCFIYPLRNARTKAGCDAPHLSRGISI